MARYVSMADELSMLEKQRDPETLKKLDILLNKLNASSTLDGLIISLMQSIDHLTSCTIGLKRDMAEIDKRLAVLDNVVKTRGKFHMLILAAIVTLAFNLGFHFLVK